MEKFLYSTVLKIRPLEGQVRAKPNAYRSLSMVLALLAEVAPSAAEQLHSDADAKPLTVSPLSRPVTEQDPWSLRVTLLDETLFGLLAEAVTRREPDRPLEVDGGRFSLVGLETAPGRDSRVACLSYRQLLEEAEVGEARWPLRFMTPTAFRSRGDGAPFPTVSLVFGSLARRWNQFSPVPVPSNLAARFDGRLVVADYRLRQVRLGFGGFFEPGFTGWCTFSARGGLAAEDRHWAHALARFAFFSGVGAKTTMGMGQVRLASSATGSPVRESGE